MTSRDGGGARWYVVASGVMFAALAMVFFTQDPIEARHRPWRGPHVSEDGWYYYYYLRSAILDGDLDLENEYRDIGNWYGFGVTETGQRHNVFGIGPAVFWAPGFLVGHAVASVSSGGSADAPADGMSRAEQTGALFTSFLAAAGAFWLAFGLSRRYVAAPAAWCGTALAFLGGPVVWYALYSPAMPHALESLLAAAFLSELLPLRRRSASESLRLGVIGGGMLLVRPQLATLFVPLAWEMASQVRRAGFRPVLAAGLLIGGTTALVFSPQLLVWKAMYGSYLVVPQGSGFMRFGASLWSETLFSSRNGLFTTTPLLWFVLPGLGLVLRHDVRLGVTLVTVLALQAFVNGAAWDWWGGGAFGGRRFAATLPVWAVALSFLLQRLAAVGRWRGARVGLTASVVVPLLALQGLMIAAHHEHRFSWETTVPFHERVRAATGLDLAVGAAAGNPFAFPANVVFALGHGVPLSRYDRAVGPYLLDERLPTTNPLLPQKRHETVTLSDPWALALVGRGFVHTRDGALLAQSRGEIFVPLNRPGPLEIDVKVDGAAHTLAWTFNGRRLGGPPFQIDGAWVRRGVNLLGVTGGPVTVRELTLVEGREWPPAWATTGPSARR